MKKNILLCLFVVVLAAGPCLAAPEENKEQEAAAPAATKFPFQSAPWFKAGGVTPRPFAGGGMPSGSGWGPPQTRDIGPGTGGPPAGGFGPGQLPPFLAGAGKNRENQERDFIGFGMNPEMIRFLGLMGFVPSARFQKFFDETKDMRKELHNMRFDYTELLRQPDTKAEAITKMENEIQALRQKIIEKAPGYRFFQP